jgi:hypothetical protein
LTILATLEVLLVTLGVTVAMVVDLAGALHEIRQHVSLRSLSVAAAWGPLTGISLNFLVGRQDPHKDFYETAAQVAAALLIAFAVDTTLPMRVPAHHRRERRGIVAGLAIGIASSLVASLWVVATDDSSKVLFGITTGGLAAALLYLFVSVGQRAVVVDEAA